MIHPAGTDEPLTTPAAPHAASAPPHRVVTFQQVLLLCVPALILGLVLRVSFMFAIPEVYYGADSNSYFDAAWKMWTHGDLVLNPKRRFLYPIVLIFMPLLPNSTAVDVAVVQHLLGLVIIVGIGWIVAQMTRFPYLWVPLVTCAAATWPRMLWFEHEMIAEVWLLAAFVATVALALPCGALKDQRRLFWFLLAAAAIVATKPHGKPLWLGLMLVALVMAGNPLKWQKKNWAMVAFAIVIIFTAGSGQQGSWLFLSSTLPFVKTEGEPYSHYRAILKPFVEEVRTNLPNYASRPRYKKMLKGGEPELSPEWFALTKDQVLYKKVANRLAIEAVLAHPLEYAQIVLRKIALASQSMQFSRIAPAAFWQGQQEANAERIKRPKNELQLVYDMPIDDYLRVVEERRQRTTWLAPAMRQVAGVLNWARYRPGAVGQDPQIELTWLGWLLALGLVACLAPRHFICRALLWFPVMLYLLVIFGIGDAVRRYMHPVEWVGLVIIAIGLDSVLGLSTDAVAWLRGRVSPPGDTPESSAGTPVASEGKRAG
jgi:hypothetical protein